MAVLSGLVLLLAVVGLSGAIVHSVSARKKELGIRVAPGAQRWQLMKMILLQTFFIAGAGIAAGILVGVAGTVLLRSQFFGIGVVKWTVLIPVSVGMHAGHLAVRRICVCQAVDRS